MPDREGGTTVSDGERVGLSLAPSKQISLAQLIDLVQLAEKRGYESVWIPETWGMDAVSILALLAAGTERISIASGVFNVYSRSAALLAQTAATLQDISRGRFILGLGASGPRVVERWHGIPFGRPLRRTREYCAVIRAALAGQVVNFVGEEMHLTGFRLTNPPITPIPIYLAALGPNNIRLAAEIADGWLPIFAARGHMRPLVDSFHTSARQYGAERRDVAAYLPAAIGPRGDRLLAEQIAYYVGGMGTFYFEFVRRLGFEREARTIREAWESGDRRGAIGSVSQRLVDLCTLGSGAPSAHDLLQGYRNDGIDLPIVTLPHGVTMDEARDTIAAFAPT